MFANKKNIRKYCIDVISCKQRKYVEIRKNFSKDWNAKYILSDLKKINPNYFPVSLKIKTNSIKLESGKLVDELIILLNV